MMVARKLKAPSLIETLTLAKRLVLKMGAAGRKSKEIAGYPCIRVGSADEHRNNLVRQVNTGNIPSSGPSMLRKRQH